MNYNSSCKATSDFASGFLKAFVVSEVTKAHDTMRVIFTMSIHVEVWDSIYLLAQCAKNLCIAQRDGELAQSLHQILVALIEAAKNRIMPAINFSILRFGGEF